MTNREMKIVRAAHGLAAVAEHNFFDSIAAQAAHEARRWADNRGWAPDVETVAVAGASVSDAATRRAGRALLSALDEWAVAEDNAFETPAGFDRVFSGLSCGHLHRTRIAAARCSTKWAHRHTIGRNGQTNGVAAVWPGLRPRFVALPSA
jgi:hypothetical protein